MFCLTIVKDNDDIEAQEIGTSFEAFKKAKEDYFQIRFNKKMFFSNNFTLEKAHGSPYFYIDLCHQYGDFLYLGNERINDLYHKNVYIKMKDIS